MSDVERAGGGQAEKEAPEPKARVLDGDDLDHMFGPDWATLVKDTDMDTSHVEMQKALVELNKTIIPVSYFFLSSFIRKVCFFSGVRCLFIGSLF